MWLDKRQIRPNDIKRYMNELVHSMGKTQINMKQLKFLAELAGW